MLRYICVGLACALALLGVVDSAAEQLVPGGRIVGGYPANIRDYPHQISMRYNGRHRCGGSIYTPTIVISAAHCVDGTDPKLMTIVAGATLLSERGYELPVEKYIMHEKYRNNDYDVAILVMRGRFPFNDYIQPIGLAKQRPAVGAEVTVTGWGTTEYGGSIPNDLQQVQVYYVDQAVCRKAYLITLTGRMLCAGAGGGKDACQGDSGGPLVYNGKLLGVVSWGIECALKNYPGIYASVPELYEWIEDMAEKQTKDFSFI